MTKIIYKIKSLFSPKKNIQQPHSEDEEKSFMHHEMMDDWQKVEKPIKRISEKEIAKLDLLKKDLANYFNNYPIDSHPNQIFCNHQNPWKDVIEYVSKFTRHYCVGIPATDRNKAQFLAIMNQTIRVFSNHHPHAPNFFDGWQLQFFYSGLDQPGNLTVVAADRNMIGHDLTELAQKECK